MLRIDNTAVLLGAHDCSPDHSDGFVFQPPPAPDGGQSVVRRLEFTAPPRKTFSTDAGREKNWFFSGLWIRIRIDPYSFSLLDLDEHPHRICGFGFRRVNLSTENWKNAS